MTEGCDKFRKKACFLSSYGRVGSRSDLKEWPIVFAPPPPTSGTLSRMQQRLPRFRPCPKATMPDVSTPWSVCVSKLLCEETN
jgi:hypothetical protein